MIGLWILHQAISIQQYLLKNGYELEASLNFALHLAFVLSIVVICTALFGCYGIFVEGSRMIQMVTIHNRITEPNSSRRIHLMNFIMIITVLPGLILSAPFQYAVLILISLVLQGTITGVIFRTVKRTIKDDTIAHFNDQQYEVQEYIQVSNL